MSPRRPHLCRVTQPNEWYRSLRIARLLDAWRGNPARDIEAIVDALVRLSWLAIDLGERLIDLEINPLIAGTVGAGVRAVDLRAEWVRGQ